MDRIIGADKIFECTNFTLTKNKATGGYSLVINVKDDVKKACEFLAEELEREDIATDFDSGNSVRLTFSDIINNLDPAIELLDETGVTRSPELGCILKIYPYICNRIRTFMGKDKMFDCEQTDRIVTITNLTVPPEEATSFLEENFGLVRQEKEGVQIKINGIRDITKTEQCKTYNLTFGKTYNLNTPKELLLPQPHSDMRSFRFYDTDHEKICHKTKSMYEILQAIFGEENLSLSTIYTFHHTMQTNSDGFSVKEINLIKSELLRLGFPTVFVPSRSIISFDFSTWDELESKYEKIMSLKMFTTTKSPLSRNFKFKVKMVQPAEKTTQYKCRMHEKLTKYDGRLFACKDEDDNYIPIGRLIAKESTPRQIFFDIPRSTNKAQEDDIQLLLDYLAHNKISEVFAVTTEKTENNNGIFSKFFSFINN